MTGRNISGSESPIHSSCRGFVIQSVERSGPRIGLLCTEGFRDVLYFRDGFKPERFNVHPRTIRRALKRLGLKLPPPHRRRS